MDVGLALLADYANVTAEGKLNIMGVFDVIYAHRFPTVHGQMQLVFSLEANPAEAGSTKQLEIKLMGEDGLTLFSLAGELSLQGKRPVPIGELLKMNQIVGLQNVRFEKPGAYQIAILINGDVKRAVSLRVQERPAQQQP